MTSAFSSNDSECIGRDVNVTNTIDELEVIWNDVRLNDCVAWISKNGFKKVSVTIRS